MPAVATAHKNRHYKTLILLVVCMTAGTFFLVWLGKLAPATPLRGQIAKASEWDRIVVRPVKAADECGFFHLRVDQAGRLFQTKAWEQKAEDPSRRRTIQIVLTTDNPNGGLTTPQQNALARLLADLGNRFKIAESRIRVDMRSAMLSSANFGA